MTGNGANTRPRKGKPRDRAAGLRHADCPGGRSLPAGGRAHGAAVAASGVDGWESDAWRGLAYPPRRSGEDAHHDRRLTVTRDERGRSLEVSNDKKIGRASCRERV